MAMASNLLKLAPRRVIQNVCRMDHHAASISPALRDKIYPKLGKTQFIKQGQSNLLNQCISISRLQSDYFSALGHIGECKE